MCSSRSSSASSATSAASRLSADQPGHRAHSRETRGGLVPSGADDFGSRLLRLHPAALVRGDLRALPPPGVVAGREEAARPGRRRSHISETPMNDAEIKSLLDARISRARAKELLIALVKVPSPQTERLEDEPLLKAFITSSIEPRLRSNGFVDLRYDPMGNLIATYDEGPSIK